MDISHAPSHQYFHCAISVLSRIFCLGGGESILKKLLDPRSGEKKIFRPSSGVRGHAPLEDFEEIVLRID